MGTQIMILRTITLCGGHEGTKLLTSTLDALHGVPGLRSRTNSALSWSSPMERQRCSDGGLPDGNQHTALVCALD